MQCYCKEQVYYLRFEASLVSDPIRCDKCGCSVDIDGMPLTAELKSELGAWIKDYNKLSEGEIKPKDVFEFLQQHSEHGLNLKEKTKKELGKRHIVR